MLGVLAIIGLLSIVFLVLLPMAIAKIKSNTTWQAVMLRATAVLTEQKVFDEAAVNDEIIIADLPNITNSGYPISTHKVDEHRFVVDVADIPQRVCVFILDMNSPVPEKIEVDGIQYEGDTSLCISYQTISFYFSLDSMELFGNICTPACSAPQYCQNGTCICPPGTPAGATENCVCEATHIEVNGTCVCPGNQIEVSGQCRCPSDIPYWNGSSCVSCLDKTHCIANQECVMGACVCQDGYEWIPALQKCLPACTEQGMSGLRDPETYTCLCLEGTNAQTCSCPDGYIYINGACQRFECLGGTTGATFTCYINDVICGNQCTSDGYTCDFGTCRPEACPSGTTFIPKNAWHVYGGCVNGERKCSNYFSNWICSNDEINGCCDASPFGECYNGTCYDKTICSTYGATYGVVQDRFGGCLFENGIRCQPVNGLWNCYIGTSAIPCGTGCADPTNCGTCQQEYCYLAAPGKCLICRDGTTPVKGTNGYYQCDTGSNELVCDVEAVGGGSPCYIDGKRCGVNCKDLNTVYCGFGSCKDPGCPAGTTFQYIPESDLYGCVNETTGISCSFNANHGGANCLYNGKSCATGCKGYDATDCDTVYLEQCSQDGSCPYGQKITETCTCPTNPEGAVGTYCCAPGHVALPGGCNQITCPDGQELDENGFCVDIE